ncbi:MAG: phage protein Gp36 family protein [Verrucomicrobiota bacterium]
MGWRAITTDDVYAGLTKPEVTALSSGHLVTGQADPVPTVIDQVTLECREAIRSCGENRLHPTSTHLPESTIRHACAIIIYRLCSRFSTVLKVSDDRRDQKNDAMKYFDKVASCARAVERYGEDESNTPSAEIEVSENVPDRQWSREKQSGL